MRIVNGMVFDGQCFRERDVVVEGDRFARVEPAGATGSAGAHDVDAQGCYVIPGLIDVHFHGAMGHDFCDAEQEGIAAIARYEASRGVTAICPTTMTLPEERLAPIVASVAEHATADDEAGIVGINMEGPYIAPDKVGAQNPAYVRSASVEEFARLQAAARGLIKLVDVAPEQPGNLDFIHSVSHDVRVSVAHTCTDYDTACAAFDAGARHMTHLYNAMPSLHHRDPGPIAAGAERNDVTAEIIADGVHIHPAMVRLAFALGSAIDRGGSLITQPARLRFGRWRIRAGRPAVLRARQPRHHCQRQLSGQRVRRHGVYAHGGAAHEHSAD